MISQNAVQLGAEPFNCSSRYLIEIMRAKLDRDCRLLFECILQQQEFALGIDTRLASRLCIPGIAERGPQVAFIHVVEARGAHYFVCAIEPYGERNIAFFR